MEAKELQIGDYVHHNLGYTLKVYDNLDKEGFDFDEYESRALLENVEPIPLTEDILKANGFEQNGFFSMKKIDTGSINSEPLTIQLGKLFDTASVYWRCGGISRDVHVPPSQLKYVHQLQHALRLCGLSELADNFKVE